jgi:YfiH family protein
MMLHAAPLSALPGLRHGFFTRQGGVSTGPYASLNCGPGSADSVPSIAENRRRVAAAMGVGDDRLCTLYQVHGPDVVTVTAPFGGERPRADAMVTDRPGLALGILTADCAPVLFADSAAGVIGACHAGWRGAAAGVTDATIEAMERLGARASRIVAAIGPTIAQRSYEVGPEFPRPFLAEDAGAGRFFTASPRAAHFLFDLPGYLVSRLSGRVGEVFDMALDTREDAERFFSFRRTTLAGEPDYGRQVSAIALLET